MTNKTMVSKSRLHMRRKVAGFAGLMVIIVSSIAFAGGWGQMTTIQGYYVYADSFAALTTANNVATRHAT